MSEMLKALFFFLVLLVKTDFSAISLLGIIYLKTEIILEEDNCDQNFCIFSMQGPNKFAETSVGIT